MSDDTGKCSWKRRTLLKTVGVASVASNLGGVTAASTPASRSTPVRATPVNVALDRCETMYAPDPRVAYFDVEARTTGVSAGVSLHGAVQDTHLKTKAIASAQQATDGEIDTTELTVFDAGARERTVRTAVASVRKDPQKDAERVTETIYGASVQVFERTGGWSHVRVPDGYLGWIQTHRLTGPVEGAFPARLRTDVTAPVNRIRTVYAGTDCRVIERRAKTVTVLFRTGATTELTADAVVEPSPPPTREALVATANQYLGTPYRWGGMTTDGIDCSGFVWMIYRIGGLTLPRDSDQQRVVGERVSRDELQPGDLLFFPGHVAVSLGGESFINALGSADEVVHTSFNPSDDNFNQRLDEEFELARRIL